MRRRLSRAWARALPTFDMATETHRPQLAPEFDCPAVTGQAPKPRVTSLGEVVRRHQHVRSVLQHPSRVAVPASERIIKTAAAKRIVVVDDEPDQVDLTVMVLEAAGHKAHGTTDGKAALGLVIDHEADLLVVGFMMPDMGGGAVGRALRAHPSANQTKIVMMSGTPEEIIRADFDQFEVFLQKPVHADRLLRTVEDL